MEPRRIAPERSLLGQAQNEPPREGTWAQLGPVVQELRAKGFEWQEILDWLAERNIKQWAASKSLWRGYQNWKEGKDNGAE